MIAGALERVSTTWKISHRPEIVSITMDDCFVNQGLKDHSGLEWSPRRIANQMARWSTFRNHPTITTEARKMLEDKVFAEYEKLIGEPVTRRKLSCVWSLGGSALYLVLRSENRIQQRGDSGSLENP